MTIIPLALAKGTLTSKQKGRDGRKKKNDGQKINGQQYRAKKISHNSIYFVGVLMFREAPGSIVRCNTCSCKKKFWFSLIKEFRFPYGAGMQNFSLPWKQNMKIINPLTAQTIPLGEAEKLERVGYLHIFVTLTPLINVPLGKNKCPPEFDVQ